jgi:sodium transport system permease protein
MSPASVVFLKECRESLRDRRVLLNALVLGPLLTPVLFLLMMHLVVGREIEKAEQPLPVAVAGGGYAPNLIEALHQAGMASFAAPADAEAAVREQRVELVLRIGPQFAADWRAGRPAQLELLFDSSRQEARSAADRLQGMIDSVSSRTASLRLLARGIAPAVVTPIVVAHRDLATPEARGAMLLGMLPYFLVLSVLIGGMWLAIDSTAGERERQSLEPLLVNPVGRGAVLLGKLLATAAFSGASLVLGLLAFYAAGRLIPAGEAGLSAGIGGRFVLRALLVMAPLVLLVSIAQIFIASFARSFREAQTYLGLAQLVPLFPSIVMIVSPLRPESWLTAVPLMGQQIQVLALLRGEAVPVAAVGLGALTTFAATAAVFALSLRLYRSERVAISA